MLQESYGLQPFMSPCVVAGGKYMLHQHLKRYSHLVKSLIAGGPTSATSLMLRIYVSASVFSRTAASAHSLCWVTAVQPRPGGSAAVQGKDV